MKAQLPSSISYSMLKRIVFALIISFGVFAITWYFFAYALFPRGHHRLFDTCNELRILHYPMIPYLQENGNQLPEESYLNNLIAENYQKPPSHEVFTNYENIDSELLQIPRKISEEKRYIDLWDTPPIYIKDKTLPDGYGFYLAGEDGISKSRGRDPDDLNSWNISSYHFYSERDRKKEELPINYIALVPAIIIFVLLMLWSKKHKRPFNRSRFIHRYTG